MRVSRQALIYYFQLFFSVQVFSQIAPMRLLDSQYFGLKSLYETMNGAHWKWHNNGMTNDPKSIQKWTFDSDEDPCIARWEGLKCVKAVQSSENFQLDALELSLFNLTGHLLDEIMLNMTTLTRLVLNGNRISGSLPR